MPIELWIARVDWCARKETAFVFTVQWPVCATMIEVQAAWYISLLIVFYSTAGHMFQPPFNHYINQSAALYVFVNSGVRSWLLKNVTRLLYQQWTVWNVHILCLICGVICVSIDNSCWYTQINIYIIAVILWIWVIFKAAVVILLHISI
jgi:hypothetical protein